MEVINLSPDKSASSYFSNVLIRWGHKISSLQDYRLFTMGLILMVQANIIIPITMLVISHYGLSNLSIGICIINSFAILVSNLASDKVKYSIPIFIVSTFLHISVILYALVNI